MSFRGFLTCLSIAVCLLFYIIMWTCFNVFAGLGWGGFAGIPKKIVVVPKYSDNSSEDGDSALEDVDSTAEHVDTALEDDYISDE